MSWSVTFASRHAFDLDAPMHRPVDGGINQEQYGIARRCARMILESGAVGDENKPMRVLLTGHANPGHEPSPHSATDGITITVTQESVVS